jgi:hypothetical protein
MLVKTKAKAGGKCKRGSRHVKGRKGCWRPSKSHSMSGTKKGQRRKTARRAYKRK